eukprot:gene16972-20196_t
MNKIISLFGGSKSSSISSNASGCVPPKFDKKQLATEPNYYYYFTKLEKSVSQPQNVFGLCQKVSGRPNEFALTDFQIDAEVTDQASQCVFTQKYKNSYTTPVEAKYVMPLPPYAAVSKFVVTYDDKVLSGKIKEKEAAFNKYSDAIASGGQAFLAEKNSDGHFTMSIGNLPPGKEVTISITMIAEIGSHFDQLHFCLHRFMFPTYKFRLVLNAKVHVAGGIQSIDMDNYKPTITMGESGDSAIVHLESDSGVTKNLIISVTPKLNDKPSHFIEHLVDADSYAVGVNFFPQLNTPPDEVEQKSEYIFLLDCSGSMSGGAIAKAKRALEILMRSLTENSKFNIVLFGSSYQSVFTTSRLYDDESLEIASAYITKIDANLGGTELLPPIRHILSQTYDPQYPRQVFILTDGEISERDQLIDYVAKEANTTRIFTFGIGSGVDRELVVGLSKACKGYYEFIEDNANMEVQVMKLLSIALEPTIANIKVNWGSLDVTQAPQVIRPIFNNERMMIYGLVNTKPSAGSHTITITADGPTGKTLTYELSLDFDHAQTKSEGLHTLAAFQIIKDLEEVERKGTKDSQKDKIVALGKKYHLVSNHTSFVVTAESDQVTEDTMTPVSVLAPPTVQPVVNAAPQMRYMSSRGGSASNSSSMMRKSSAISSISNNTQCMPPPPPMAYPSAPMGGCPPPAPPGRMSGPPPPMAYQSQQQDMMLDSLCESISRSRSISSDLDCDEEAELCEPLDNCKTQSLEMCIQPTQADDCIQLSAPSKQKKSASPSIFSSLSQKLSSSPTSSTSCSAPLAPPQKKDMKEREKASPKASSGDLLMDLIRAQKANGSWVASSITLTVAPAPSALDALADVWTTLVVIAYLSKKFADKSAQWDLVVQKATKWVKSQLNKANIGDQFDALLAKA